MAPVIDWSSSLEEYRYPRELQTILNDALARLRPIDRCVVMLSDGEEMSDRDIARLLGLTTSAVRSRLHRSRSYLRSYLSHRLGDVRRRKQASSGRGQDQT
jgi:RNA polymerase sigma factor (sigma-70 family)